MCETGYKRDHNTSIKVCDGPITYISMICVTHTQSCMAVDGLHLFQQDNVHLDKCWDAILWLQCNHLSFEFYPSTHIYSFHPRPQNSVKSLRSWAESSKTMKYNRILQSNFHLHYSQVFISTVYFLITACTKTCG